MLQQGTEGEQKGIWSRCNEGDEEQLEGKPRRRRDELEYSCAERG